MPILILKKYWKLIALILVISVSMLAIYFYGNHQYNKGVAESASKMQDKFDKINAEQSRRMAQASAKYQAEKKQREAEQEVQYVEVERIVEKPIYRNVCLDDDGVSQINRAAGHK